MNDFIVSTIDKNISQFLQSDYKNWETDRNSALVRTAMHREMHALSRASALQYIRTVEASGLVTGIVARVMREDVSAVDMAVLTAPVAVDLTSFAGVDPGGFRNSFGHELPP